MGLAIVKDQKVVYLNKYAENFIDSIDSLIKHFLNEIQLFNNWQEHRNNQQDYADPIHERAHKQQDQHHREQNEHGGHFSADN